VVPIGGRLVTFTLAHVGHWYHALLYLAPILLIGLGLWWSSRRDAGPEREDGDDAAQEQQ
jgi:hypothetical protein